MADIKKESTNSKLENFIFKNRKAIITVAGVAIVAAVAVCVVVGIKDLQARKGLAAVDQIEFEYTVKSAELSDSEISARQDKALSAIESLCTKSGIVGVRANMLCADINFEKKYYAEEVWKPWGEVILTRGTYYVKILTARGDIHYPATFMFNLNGHDWIPANGISCSSSEIQL
ncbi:MAG: hypothetical protein MR856_02660, partial [Spirochaetia bacterium]|nr:hypothetical protein [Spirochaetia bacterium]